jgi:hypothetical protein
LKRRKAGQWVLKRGKAKKQGIENQNTVKRELKRVKAG